MSAKVFRAVLLFIVWQLLAPSLHAFGFREHLVATRIAWEELSAPVRLEVVRFISAAEPELQSAYDTQSDDRKDVIFSVGKVELPFERAALWADLWRARHRNTATYHYVNATLEDERYNPESDPKGVFVVSKLNEFIRILRDTSKSDHDRGVALLWVIHLTEDVHQPLHVFSNGDKGGNELVLHVAGQTRRTNLHSYWDDGVFVPDVNNISEFQKTVCRIGEKLEPRMLEVMTPVEWANENRDIARAAYKWPGRERMLVRGDQIGADYREKHFPIACQRLFLAGQRLAKLLNAAFADPTLEAQAR